MKLLQGNVLEVLKTLPDQSVQCCVTSPPYFGLRSYIDNNSPDKFLEMKRIAGFCACIFILCDGLFEKRTATEYPTPKYIRYDGKNIHHTEAIHGGHERSRFYTGIAEAMAEQWGNL